MSRARPKSAPSSLARQPGPDWSVLARIKSLFRDQAIYGFGAVATSVLSLLLLPVFTRYLTPADYGVIAMLAMIEAATKVAFRWGVDLAFMRLYYDCADQAARQRLASTVFLFLLAANGSLLVAGLASASWLSGQIFGTKQQALLIGLTMANTFVAGFYFIPFQVLRIEERSGQFIALTIGRLGGTLVARLALVIGAGLGVLGIVLSDVIVTAVFTVILSRWFVKLIRPTFSPAVMRQALVFGLPRIPHSISQQIVGFADRYFLNAYGTLNDVGLYSIGASFGQALKLFLSAFDTAWAPFFLTMMREKDAQRIYSVVSTYVTALLVLLVAGLCATAPDIVRLFTTPDFFEASTVTPWIALGVMFQGLNLLGSIGLIIKKRTAPYPIATGIAAAAGVLANVLLIPRFGGLGAAWANMLAYFMLAAVTGAFSWAVYPIRYEWSRLTRIALGGVAGYVASRFVARSAPALPGLLMHGAVVVAVYLIVLYASGFFHAGELKLLRSLRQRMFMRPGVSLPTAEPIEVGLAGEAVDPGLEPMPQPLKVEPGAGTDSISGPKLPTRRG